MMASAKQGEEPSMEYIQKKADELIQCYKQTGCAPIEPLAKAWDDPKVPNESLKLYSDYIGEVWAKPPYSEMMKEFGDQFKPQTKILVKMTLLERMALDCVRRV